MSQFSSNVLQIRYILKFQNICLGRTGTIVRLGIKGKPDPLLEPEEARARSPAKRPVASAMLNSTGMEGDYNQYRAEVNPKP